MRIRWRPTRRIRTVFVTNSSSGVDGRVGVFNPARPYFRTERPLGGGRITGKSLTISTKRVGVTATFQRLIPTGERSGLQTRIATTEIASLCVRMNCRPRFWNWNRQSKLVELVWQAGEIFSRLAIVKKAGSDCCRAEERDRSPHDKSERASSPNSEGERPDWSDQTCAARGQKSLEPRSQHFTISRHASPRGGFLFPSRAPEQQSRGPEGEHEDWGEPPPFLFVRLSFVESHEKIDKSRTRDRTVVRTFFLRCGFMIQ
jgi:hypothetical protein